MRSFDKEQKALLRLLQTSHNRRKKIVFTNGCYDLIHSGHIRYLKQAKSLGDILIVGVNSDSSIKKLKGQNRPVLKLRERMELLEEFQSVDYVIPFAESTPLNLIKLLKPDILIKGGDWKKGEIVGQDVVEAYGGEVVRGLFVKGRSTTQIIEAIQKIENDCSAGKL